MNKKNYLESGLPLIGKQIGEVSKDIESSLKNAEKLKKLDKKNSIIRCERGVIFFIRPALGRLLSCSPDY